MARLRVTSTVLPKGIAVALHSPLTDIEGSAGTKTDWCSDVIGNFKGQNPLTITHTNNVKWEVSGLRNNWWDCKDFSVTSSIPGGSPPDTAEPSDGATLTHALAVTNPNTPRVDVPQFVAELGDLPRAIKLWGDTLLKAKRALVNKKGVKLVDLPRKIAEHHLDYQFNIVPTLSDVGHLLDFQNSVDRKMRQLNNLGKVGHSSGTATSWKNLVESIVFNEYATSLYQETRRVQSKILTRRKKWGSAIWKPVTPLPTMTDDDERALAIRLAYGLNFSFSQVWELMPWSWLIDWFSNLGDVIASNRNEIPVVHGGSCVMKRTTISRQIVGTTPGSGNTLRVHSPPWNSDVKTRVVMGDALPQLEFNLPVLSGKQLSILGAIATVWR